MEPVPAGRFIVRASLLGLSLIVIGSFAACGGSTASSSGTTTNDAGVGTTDGGAMQADAGSTSDADVPDAADFPADVYPAPHHPLPTLKNLGGSVMANMKIVTVTYVGEAERDALRAFDDSIVSGAWWTAVTEGFGINAGTSGGYVELADDVSGRTLDNDADLAPYLAQLVTDGKLPAPDENTLYAIYFPASTTITLQGQTSCQSFGAYHNSAAFSVNGNAVDTAFAVIPNCGGGRSDSASHEFIEAATDPHPETTTAWYANGYAAWFGFTGGGGEAADLCENGPGTLVNGQTVARSWVNAAAIASRNPCVPATAGAIYYNAAIDTKESYPVTDPQGSGTHLSEGFISVKRGSSSSVEVVVFSEAALPHDLALVVSKRSRGGSNPMTVTPIAQGVTATLSKTTGHNGTRLTLTISADATTPKGDYKFVVRSVLETTDTQSWPAILRVL
jgi:hypothetical protein